MTAAPDNLPVPVYMVDTHPLVWQLIGSKKLSPTALSVLGKAETGEAVIVVPAVVLAELFMIAEKGRTALFLSALKIAVQRWQLSSNIRLTSLTPEQVISSSQFGTIPDIFDRLILAEAQTANIPLITYDTVITASGLVSVVW